MRRFGTDKQVAKRRKYGVELAGDGKSTKEIANRLGVTTRTVRRWKTYKSSRGNKPPRGVEARLNSNQLKTLQKELRRGSVAHGYEEEYWTCERVANLIGDLFDETYSVSGAWRLLRRMGWSSQKPQRRSLSRDDQEVEHWLKNVWPKLKKTKRNRRDVGVRG